MAQTKIEELKESEWQPVTGGSADEYWRPKEEGDQIIGQLTGSTDGNMGRTYLLDVQGRVIGLPSHVALVNNLSKVPVGNVVRCTFLGQNKSSKSHMTYSNYRVEVKRDSSRDFA